MDDEIEESGSEYFSEYTDNEYSESNKKKIIKRKKRVMEPQSNDMNGNLSGFDENKNDVSVKDIEIEKRKPEISELGNFANVDPWKIDVKKPKNGLKRRKRKYKYYKIHQQRSLLVNW